MHCIRNGEKYKKSRRIAAGSEKWLETRVWDTSKECFLSLKSAGYQIVVTHLSSTSTTIQVILGHDPAYARAWHHSTRLCCIGM